MIRSSHSWAFVCARVYLRYLPDLHIVLVTIERKGGENLLRLESREGLGRHGNCNERERESLGVLKGRPPRCQLPANQLLWLSL